MSHFSVLVITNEKPTEEVLSKTLMPWHEYECTGIEEYLQDVDRTEEVLEEYNKPQKVVVLANDTTVSRWDDSLYTKLSDDEFDRKMGRKKFELPTGAIEKELSADEARKHDIGYATEEEAAEAWCGATRGSDGKFYKRTNPNAKWDWWVRGGRYQGKLLAKNQAKAIVGRPGTFDNPPLNANGVDSCQARDLDLAKMQKATEDRAAEAYDAVHRIIAGRSFDTWRTVQERHGEAGLEAARDEYTSQPIVKDLKSCEYVGFFGDPSDFLVPREKYLSSARNRALSTFAVVKDGDWFERGEMGWWACVSNEKDKDEWDKKFAGLIEGLAPTMWLTIVDCHI